MIGFGEVVRDPEEAEARMAAWAKGFEEKAARYRAVGEQTEALRLTASSPNGAVRVTVRADGSLTGIEFGDRARTIPLEHLPSMIMDTVHRAQSGIAGRVAEVMAEGLGDEDLQTRSMMLDNLRERFPELETDENDEEPAQVRDDVRDDEENEPW
ncbi:hypothetical protein Lesp02_14760 [Lentzea sp. NBRC 105346]|uniref:YbaB/EbfC family nucleoid-associated protein n=1 Tax=Lentzea sp. NBRC 105346 TaxID=3032205 RepID=UPI0024A15004|nr:YbaB/EbfC family nucleoid-associated protein [Lentzea sp. NBRC 105346]GLZ29286.1 hypothetical protein Lesp02_14760 [Lentzea sp. NBRC 105346]